MPAASPAARSGTQSIERALRMLRELAARGEFGWRLSDLAERCEVDKGTAHRMLACLVRERFVQQRAADRHYFPGPMLYELGLSLPGHAAFREACEPRLALLAAHTQAIAWVQLRSGNEYVCIARQGDIALRGMMVHVGTRRPLIVSVGGAAMLLRMPAAEAKAVLAANLQHEVAQRGRARLAALKRMRDCSRRHGFGVNLGEVAPRIHAFALALCDAEGVPFGALCLTGPAARFPEKRAAEIRALLEPVAADLQAEGQRLRVPSPPRLAEPGPE